MLYDPKWEAPVKADPFSLASLIAWLEMQPVDGQYDYILSHDCVIAQWLRGAGVEHFNLSSGEVKALFGGKGQDIAWATSGPSAPR